MKIAMIGHKQIPGRSGGVEVVVEELSTRMAQTNEVTVYNRKNGKKQLKEYNGVHINEVFTINKKSLDALIYSFLASLKVLFKKYDVIHYHALGPSVMLIIPKIFKRKTKIVATVHGLDWQRAKWGGFGTKYLKLGEKIIAKYADEVIVLSKNMQKYFKDNYNRDTIYIPNGIPENKKLTPNKIKQFNLSEKSYILFLSRIVPEKGLHYLIDAYNKMDTDKKLVIAGTSSNTNDYYNEIVEKTKQNPNIIMTGFVSGELLNELYTNAALFVLPSEIEGMPMVLLEAISYDIPVLASNIPENVEIVGIENTFKSKNVDDLKKQIEKKLENNISVNINKEKYDWDNITEETLNVYRKD